MNFFIEKKPETELELKVSKLINLKLLKLKFVDQLNANNININIFENLTNYSIKKKYYPRYPWSLQRKLQFTLLDFLKDIFDLDENAIDVASENTNYLSYIGFNKSNSKCLVFQVVQITNKI